MRTDWNSILNEEGEGSISKQSYTKWLTLGTGACSEDGSDSREDPQDSTDVDQIGEDIVNIVFCKLPLPTLFQAQAVCVSWKTFISTSVHFHNTWERSNKQLWLVMDLHTEGDGVEASKGLAFYDVNRKIWYKKMFNDEWKDQKMEWFLRDGDGGLLIYSNYINGFLKVINPLTMQIHCLEDARLTRTHKNSEYIRSYDEEAYARRDRYRVLVHLKFDPEGKTYQVFVTILNINLVKGKNCVVSIYKSSERRWFSRWFDMGIKIGLFPRVLLQNQKMYFFSKHGGNAALVSLNENDKFHYISEKQGVNYRVLGIVMFRGRMIIVCKGSEFPPYPHTLSFYELDDRGMQWGSKYGTIRVPPQFLEEGNITCVGGDYIWIKDHNTWGYIRCIIRIDLDNREVNELRGVLEYNGIGCVSTRLSFCSCP